MLAYLLRGTLPWQELPTNVKDVEGRLKIITQRKINMSAENLFKGQASGCLIVDFYFIFSKNLIFTFWIFPEFSEEFTELHRYTRALTFMERPDYAYLRNLMRTVFDRTSKIDSGYQFEWVDRTTTSSHEQHAPALSPIKATQQYCVHSAWWSANDYFAIFKKHRSYGQNYISDGYTMIWSDLYLIPSYKQIL